MLPVKMKVLEAEGSERFLKPETEDCRAAKGERVLMLLGAVR